MTYRPHALLRFGGRWFAGEEWSCGLRLITDDSSATVEQWVNTLEPNEPGGIPTFLQDVADIIYGWFSTPSQYISNKAWLDYVSCNAIQPNGDYADPGNPHTLEFGEDAIVGPSEANTWPQLTTVMSLRTAVQRGLATRGRVYLPTAITAQPSGLIGGGDTVAMANAFAGMLEEIAGVDSPFLAGGVRAGVVSDVGSPGPARIVTRVLVGNVIDTQRRRRNQLVEAYGEADVVTAP